MSAAIKVQISYSNDGIEPKYLQFNTNANSPYPLDITGYTRIVAISGSGMSDMITAKDGTMRPTDSYITIDADTHLATYHDLGQPDIVLALPIRTDLTSETVPTGLNPSDLVFTLTGETLDMTLYMQSYAIRNPNYTGIGNDTGINQERAYYNISGVALIRDKR